jgi:hypothetical protein
MQVTSANQDRDASHHVIGGLQSFLVSKSMTLAGGTTNDPGDFDGTGNPATLFTVTGNVVATVFGVCTVNLAGAGATLEVGIAGNTAALIAQSTATDIDAGTVWIDATPATIQALPSSQIIANGTDIIQTAGTANITAGAITYYCFWRPLSSTGNVIAA